MTKMLIRKVTRGTTPLQSDVIHSQCKHYQWSLVNDGLCGRQKVLDLEDHPLILLRQCYQRYKTQRKISSPRTSITSTNTSVVAPPVTSSPRFSPLSVGQKSESEACGATDVVFELPPGSVEASHSFISSASSSLSSNLASASTSAASSSSLSVGLPSSQRRHSSLLPSSSSSSSLASSSPVSSSSRTIPQNSSFNLGTPISGQTSSYTGSSVSISSISSVSSSSSLSTTAATLSSSLAKSPPSSTSSMSSPPAAAPSSSSSSSSSSSLSVHSLQQISDSGSSSPALLGAPSSLATPSSTNIYNPPSSSFSSPNIISSTAPRSSSPSCQSSPPSHSLKHSNVGSTSLSSALSLSVSQNYGPPDGGDIVSPTISPRSHREGIPSFRDFVYNSKEVKLVFQAVGTPFFQKSDGDSSYLGDQVEGNSSGSSGNGSGGGNSAPSSAPGSIIFDPSVKQASAGSMSQLSERGDPPQGIPPMERHQSRSGGTNQRRATFSAKSFQSSPPQEEVDQEVRSLSPEFLSMAMQSSWIMKEKRRRRKQRPESMNTQNATDYFPESQTTGPMRTLSPLHSTTSANQSPSSFSPSESPTLSPTHSLSQRMNKLEEDQLDDVVISSNDRESKLFLADTCREMNKEARSGPSYSQGGIAIGRENHSPSGEEKLESPRYASSFPSFSPSTVRPSKKIPIPMKYPRKYSMNPKRHLISVEHDEWIVLNVGGYRYETYVTTLRSYPETMLARMFDPDNRRILQTDKNGEYLLDRNGRAFESVLEFLRTGRVFLAPGVSEEQLAIEFDYFQLPMVTELGHRDFAKQFSQPTHWHEEAMRLFDKVSHDIFDAIRKETIEGANYSLRIALLPMDELYNCQGRLGPIVRGDVRFVKHPSPSGGWCLVIDHAGRYFLDQIKASYERLGFWTTITKFRYCHCDECQKNVIMTRYLTIHWNIQDNNHAILEKLIDISNALDAGINVWNCNPNTSKTS